MTTGPNDGPRVLLVEDSMIIALDTEECLLALGAREVVVQATVSGALEALAGDPFNFALLDFSLGSETSEEIARSLAAHQIPFWLATGYGEMDDKVADLGARGLLVKPYGRAELVRLMAEFDAT